MPDKTGNTYRIKPLVWGPQSESRRNQEWKQAVDAHTPFGRYFIDWQYNNDSGWCWGYWPFRSDEPCKYGDVDSLEEGKRQAEAHYKALVEGALEVVEHCTASDQRDLATAEPAQ